MRPHQNLESAKRTVSNHNCLFMLSAFHERLTRLKSIVMVGRPKQLYIKIDPCMNHMENFHTFKCFNLAFFERARTHIQTLRVSLFSTTSDGEKRSTPVNPRILHICEHVKIKQKFLIIRSPRGIMYEHDVHIKKSEMTTN